MPKFYWVYLPEIDEIEQEDEFERFLQEIAMDENQESDDADFECPNCGDIEDGDGSDHQCGDQ